MHVPRDVAEFRLDALGDVGHMRRHMLGDAPLEPQLVLGPYLDILRHVLGMFRQHLLEVHKHLVDFFVDQIRGLVGAVVDDFLDASQLLGVFRPAPLEVLHPVKEQALEIQDLVGSLRHDLLEVPHLLGKAVLEIPDLISDRFGHWSDK